MNWKRPQPFDGGERLESEASRRCDWHAWTIDLDEYDRVAAAEEAARAEAHGNCDAGANHE